MADITKCPGLGCPIRDECYRYTAPAGDRQSWFMMTPGYYVWAQKTGGPLSDHRAEWDCDEYLPVKWEPTSGRNGSSKHYI